MKITEKAIEFVLTRQLEALATLTVDQVAIRLKVPKGELTCSFEEDQKIPLEQYILREKLMRGALILEKNLHISVDQLAQLLGFTTTVDFERTFKLFLAVTPARYRELLQVANNC